MTATKMTDATTATARMRTASESTATTTATVTDATTAKIATGRVNIVGAHQARSVVHSDPSTCVTAATDRVIGPMNVQPIRAPTAHLSNQSAYRNRRRVAQALQPQRNEDPREQPR
jgi:hypothetical protein